MNGISFDVVFFCVFLRAGELTVCTVNIHLNCRLNSVDTKSALNAANWVPANGMRGSALRYEGLNDEEIAYGEETLTARGRG